MESKALCLSCHATRADDLKKKDVHPPFLEGDCTSCHQPHSSEQPHLLVSPVTELCTTCHDTASPALSQAHFGIKKIEGDCTACHSPHGSDNAKLIREGKQHVPFQSRSCATCHAATGADGKANLKDIPEKTCFVCHTDISKLNDKPVVHPPFGAGACMSCHEPHIRRLPAQLKKVPEVLCFECHDPALKDNHPVPNHPTSKKGVLDPLRKDLPFNCVSCHEPHGGEQAKMLRYDPKSLCEGCHQK